MVIPDAPRIEGSGAAGAPAETTAVTNPPTTLPESDDDGVVSTFSSEDAASGSSGAAIEATDTTVPPVEANATAVRSAVFLLVTLVLVITGVRWWSRLRNPPNA